VPEGPRVIASVPSQLARQAPGCNAAGNGCRRLLLNLLLLLTRPQLSQVQAGSLEAGQLV
jgi:hypothetical protein